jgi:hypothetical protein
METHTPGTNALLGETLSRETHAPQRHMFPGEILPTGITVENENIELTIPCLHTLSGMLKQ